MDDLDLTDGAEDALAEVLGQVAERIPRVRLGVWPTPVEPVDVLPGIAAGRLWTKREDLSSPLYGGNKVRPLETVFAAHLAAGVGHVWMVGGFGSNQALAGAIHGPRAGLEVSTMLFPQPPSSTAVANLDALGTVTDAVEPLWHVAGYPWAVWSRQIRGRRRQPRSVVIPAGAATPLGAVGHVTAALEVALEVKRGAIPAPRHVVLPVGSTCTTAGLLVGFALAAKVGLGFVDGPPSIHAVRIAPWPVTARFRILRLARATAALLSSRGAPLVRDPVLARSLTVASGYLGGGYGQPTQAGQVALASWRDAGAPQLDTTYSAKAAAYLTDHLGALDGPVLFWSTKSSAPLHTGGASRLTARSRVLSRWVERVQGART